MRQRWNRDSPGGRRPSSAQYAAQDPSIYFFRACCTCAALLLGQAGIALLRRAQWALPLLGLAGLGLGGAAVVSCEERDAVHLTFAFLFFVSFGLVSACAACAAAATQRRARHSALQPRPPLRDASLIALLEAVVGCLQRRF